MILLRSPGLLFIKPRKVGGTSFEIALSQFAEPDDIITPISPIDEELRRKLGGSPRNWQYKLSELPRAHPKKVAWAILNRDRPAKFYNHILPIEAEKRLGTTFSEVKKISIIRNPFDMAVSFYFWDVRTPSQRSLMGFEEYVISHLGRLSANLETYSLRNQNIVDFMIRYENFQSDLKKLEGEFPQVLGLHRSFHAFRAKSEHRPRLANTKSMFLDAPKAANAIQQLFSEVIDKYESTHLSDRESS